MSPIKPVLLLAACFMAYRWIASAYFRWAERRLRQPVSNTIEALIARLRDADQPLLMIEIEPGEHRGIRGMTVRCTYRVIGHGPALSFVRRRRRGKTVYRLIRWNAGTGFLACLPISAAARSARYRWTLMARLEEAANEYFGHLYPVLIRRC